MVWNEELKREIPKDWKVEKLSSTTRIASGFPFKSSEYVPHGKYRIITIKNVLDGEIDSSSAESVSDIPKKIPDVCKLGVGDILISLTGNVGRMGVIFEHNLLLNQRVGKLIVSNQELFLFSYFLLSSNEQRVRLERFSNGSSQANLSPIQAVDFNTFIPDSGTLKAFNGFVAPILDRMISSRQESKRLMQIRDWLLPLLMNGQIKIN